MACRVWLVLACLLVVLVGVAAIYAITKWSLQMLRAEAPLSWRAVALVAAYAISFTAIVLAVLIAVAVAFAVAEVARCACSPHL